MPNYAIQEQNQDMVSLLSAYFRLLYNPAHALADAVGMLQMFPGLRGLWVGSSVNATGQLLDISGTGLNLTNNNNALIGYKANTLIPRVLYNGTTQYHSRPDGANLDITGTEAFINQPGLTIGAWVQFDVAAAATEMIASKWATSNLSYNINRQASGVLRFSITNDGSTTVSVDTTATMSENVQYFVCGRFIPSTSIEARINGTWAINTTSIPASIFSGTADFELASSGGGSNFMDGRITLAFLCAAAVPDQFIDAYYQMTAPLFGISI